MGEYAGLQAQQGGGARGGTGRRLTSELPGGHAAPCICPACTGLPRRSPQIARQRLTSWASRPATWGSRRERWGSRPGCRTGRGRRWAVSLRKRQPGQHAARALAAQRFDLPPGQQLTWWASRQGRWGCRRACSTDGGGRPATSVETGRQPAACRAACNDSHKRPCKLQSRASWRTHAEGGLRGGAVARAGGAVAGACRRVPRPAGRGAGRAGNGWAAEEGSSSILSSWRRAIGCARRRLLQALGQACAKTPGAHAERRAAPAPGALQLPHGCRPAPLHAPGLPSHRLTRLGCSQGWWASSQGWSGCNQATWGCARGGHKQAHVSKLGQTPGASLAVPRAAAAAPLYAAVHCLCATVPPAAAAPCRTCSRARWLAPG